MARLRRRQSGSVEEDTVTWDGSAEEKPVTWEGSAEEKPVTWEGSAEEKPVTWEGSAEDEGGAVTDGVLVPVVPAQPYPKLSSGSPEWRSWCSL